MASDIPQWATEVAEVIAKEATRDAMRDPLMPYYITVAPHIARALIQAEARGAERQWLPIETAPRDGSFVLLYNRAHKHTCVLGWTPNSSIFEEDAEEGGMWTDAGGRNVPANVCYNDGGYFSFWQPLPAPPAIRNLEAKDAG